MTHPLRERYDTIIVGGRCAGAATAFLLARAGQSVLLVDRESYGSDTLSTHALMRTGVLQLHRWGLLDAITRAGTPAARSSHFYYGSQRYDIAIRERHGVDALYSPRRTVLDRTLVDAARAAGADCRHQTRVVQLLRGPGGRVTGVLLKEKGGPIREVRANIVVGADGVRSQVARSVGALPYRVGQHKTATVYSHWPGLKLTGNHWYFARGLAAGAIPSNDGLTCIFILVPPERFHHQLHHNLEVAFTSCLQEIAPSLSLRVSERQRVGSLRAFAGQEGFLRPCWGPGWALVGDAGYFKDPCTAHGMSDALRDAEFLSNAILRGGAQALAEYQAQRDFLSVPFFEISDSVASFDWSLEQVKGLHRGMSEELEREEEALVSSRVPLGLAS